MSMIVPERGQRPIDRCDGLAAFSESAVGLSRPYLTASHRQSLEQTRLWMSEAGMRTWIDPVGNLVGRYDGAVCGAPALLIGSHIDTVHDAGRYDGALGVMMGIECVEILNRAGRRLPFAVEVIAFGDEEGSRFATSMMCSRALVCAPPAEALALQDASGVSLRQALLDFGLDPGRLGEAVRRPGDVLAYVEAHIEQGPVLEAEDKAVGVVTAIAAQLRLKAVITGQAGHAGTSPMAIRKDAIAASAEAVLAVEAICRGGGPDLRGTVGCILPRTAAFNVIAGNVELGVDLRAATEAARDAAALEVREQFQALCDRRGVDLEFSVVQDLGATPCDPRLVALLDEAVAVVRETPFHLLSGAGHDAMALAPMCPVAMLFIRCEHGLSHHADEAVNAADVAVGVDVLTAFIDRLAKTHVGDQENAA
jgi:allantoate deiminase